MVKYLITSGNSQTGKATIEHLKAFGETDIVAGARDPVKSEAELKKAGASEVVEFDFTKPDTVEKALKGVERVLMVHGATDLENYVTWTQLVVDVAKKTSTVKVIGKIAGYLSDSSSNMAVPKLHGQNFETLAKSGLQYFAVGPCFFFENWLHNKKLIQTGAVYGAAGDAKVMYIAADDIGAAAAAAIRNPEKYNGKHIPIMGDFLSEAEVLKAINDAAGTNAKYVSLENKVFEENLIKFGVPATMAGVLAFFETVKAMGVGKAEDIQILRDLIGRDPLTAKTWAEKYANKFK